MLTRQERRQLEAQWSADDRSIADFARLLKTAVLSILVVALLWIAGTGARSDDSQQAGNAGAPSAPQGEGGAVRASRQAFEERRAQWEGKQAQPARQAASH